MYERAKTNFIFTPKEAKLRRLLREALELANEIDGPYAAQFHGICPRTFPAPEGTHEIEPIGEIRNRFGTWGAITEALLASGLETAEGLDIFYNCNEWSHRRCPSLSLDD